MNHMNKRNVVYSFCLLIFLGISNLFAAHIIFDMHGVLVTQAPVGSFWEIGPSRFFGGFNPLRIEDTFFDFLESLIPRRPDAVQVTHNGRLLPQIMCDYQAGIITSQEVLTLITKKLNELASAFDSQRKVQLIQAIADFIFTPERFAKVIVPLKSGVKILKRCYREKDSQGERKHKIYIVTNWDAESFLLLYDNPAIRKFLELADGIVVSGNVGLLKPSKEIFMHAFDFFDIDPNREFVCYIDDERSNILAARNLNFPNLKCIHCSHFNFKEVDKTLRRWGIY